MKHTISLELDELNSGLIDQLKELFKNARQKRVTIIVDDELDETDYLLESPANRERLLRSLENARKGNFVTHDLDAYRNLSGNA
jgi:antitoxin YefM